MTLQQVAFGGLAALQADELIDIHHAIDATNCQVDDGTLFGRNGYRSVTSGGGILPNGHGTATSGTATSLTDSTQTWSNNQWQNYTVSITAGTGVGQIATISSNTATTLTVPAYPGVGCWSNRITPDTTSVYQIQGNVQGAWRFRPGPTNAWTLACIKGRLLAVTDPTSETNGDGVSTSVATLFGATDNVSGVQLGTYFYLASDNLSYSWVRARNSTGTLVTETLTGLPKGGTPTASAGSLVYTPFGTHTAFSLAGGATAVDSGITNWVNLAGSVGGTATYDIGAGQNWSGCKWLFVACSPETLSGGGGQFSISIAADVSGSPGPYFTLATIVDPPGGNGSPYCVYLPLATVGLSTLSAIRYIQFKQLGPTSDPFSVAGYMIVPSPPSGSQQYFVTFANVENAGTATSGSSTTIVDTSQSWTANAWANYTVTIIGGTGNGESATVISNTGNTLTVGGWNVTPDNTSVYQIGNVTLQESVPTDFVTVNYSASNITPPTFHAAKWNYNSFNDVGVVSSDPDVQNISTLFNIGGGIAVPKREDLGTIYTITGTAPSATPGAYNTVRLWRLTATGYRLAKFAKIAVGGTYSLRDDGGDTVLANQAYIAGGLPPPATALTARGGRLICGGDPSHPNRLTISSYVPINTSTEGQGLAGTAPDPFPQFPAIPLQDSDGWAFDISPTAAEQILWLGNGDALYIATNEALYALNDLTPNSPPFRVFERGVVGRRAAIWAEGSLHRVWGIEEKLETGAIFWASHDGIYTSYNRVSAHEVTKTVRRIYRNWLQPDSTTVLAYQDRKLYCICRTKMLRFDFVTETWTRHTPTHSMLASASFRDPPAVSNLQRLFFLASDNNVYRWQPGIDYADSNRATTDAGINIPAWTYSTGYAAESVKTRLTHYYADVTGGAVTINAYKDSGTTGPPTRSFTTPGEHEYSVAAYVSGAQSTAAVGYKWRLALSGSNSAQVRRLMWDREQTSGHGG